MKIESKIAIIFFILCVALPLSRFVQATVPQISGLPNISAERNGDSWTLKMPGGQVFIFTADKQQQLQVFLNPLGAEINAQELNVLQSLSINPGSAIPSVFLLVPYARGKRARLYQCYITFSNNRLSCSILLLTPVPIPNSPSITPTQSLMPHSTLVPLTPIPNTNY